MGHKHAILAVLVLAFGGMVRSEEEPAGDLVPLMPVGQSRFFNNFAYYGGPSGNSFLLSPDGKFAVSNAGGGNQLMVYELGKQRPGRQGRPLVTDNPNFYRPALAFAPDGKTLIGMSNNFPDYNLHFWDITTGKETRQIDNDQQFNSLAISPDGKLLALGTNQRAEIWDAASSDDLRVLSGPLNTYFQALAFSADGRMLAGATTDTVFIWEVISGRERLSLRLNANPQTIPPNFNFRGIPMGQGLSALAFSADGTLLATGGSDNAIRLWALATGQELPPLVGHQGMVTSLVFTNNGKRLLSLDGNGLRLDWDARRLKAGPSKLRAPAEGEMVDLWEGLAEADAFQTYRAARLLAAKPVRALAFLQKRLQPVPASNTEQITQLVAGLQNASGSVRRRAMAGLRKQGEAALGALLQAAQNNPGAGFNQNLGMMINKLDHIYNTPERQRALKGILVLELIGTPEAKKLLAKLAKGASGTPLTKAASLALERLKARSPAGQTASDPKTLWDDLSGDAAKAFQAIVQLAGQPDKTLPWLREQMKPVAAPDPKHLEELVAALDNPQFAVRQKAMTDLDKIGEAAIPVLKKTLGTPISLEAKKRIEQLLSRLNRQDLSSYQLRQLRALEVLERIGTGKAGQLLQELAQGAPNVRLTREAAASLGRLEKRGVTRK